MACLRGSFEVIHILDIRGKCPTALQLVDLLNRFTVQCMTVVLTSIDAPALHTAVEATTATAAMMTGIVKGTVLRGACSVAPSRTRSP